MHLLLDLRFVTSRAPFFALIALLAIVAGAVFFWPASDESTRGERNGLAETSHSPAVDERALNPAQPDSADIPVTQSEETPLRTETDARSILANGQRVLEIIGVDGQPLEGVSVHYQLEEASERARKEIQDAIAAKRELDLWRGFESSPSSTTDSLGRALLPSEGVGLAGVRVRGAHGVKLLGPWSSNESEPIRLVLQAVKDFEVTVIDAAGDPIEGMTVYFVHDTLEERERRARGDRPRGRPNRSLGQGGVTNAEGKVVLSAQFSEGVLDQVDAKAEGFELRVKAAVPFDTVIEAPILFGQTEPVQLQLPKLGGAQIRLQGYPDNVIPVLRESGNLSFNQMLRSIQAQPRPGSGKDGVFFFDHLALGKQLQVEFRRHTETAQGTRIESSSFPAQQMLGPTVAGEIVEAEFELAAEGTLTGRILGADGQPVGELRDSSALVIQARTNNLDLLPVRLPYERGKDGTFIARLPNENEHNLQLHDFVEIMIEHNLLFENLQGESDVPAVWAKVPLQIPVGTAQHDLGDVQLGCENPIMRIRVVNEQGDPVPGAILRFETEGREHEFQKELRWIESEAPAAARRTGADGWAVVSGFQVEDAIRPRHRKLMESTGRKRVIARHADYLESKQLFRMEESEVTVVMSGAVELSGRARVPFGLFDMRYVALDPGVGYQDFGGFQGPGGQLYPGNNQAVEDESGVVIPFSIKPLKPGRCDLVFYLGRSDREVLRLQLVDILSDTELPEVIDLVSHLDTYRFTLLAQDGTELGHDDAQRGAIMLRTQVGDGGTSGTTPVWHEGKLHTFAPRGEQQLSWIATNGSRAISLVGFPPGEHVVQFGKPRVVDIVFEHTAELPEGHRLVPKIIGGRQDIGDPLEAPPGVDLRLKVGPSVSFLITWTRFNADDRMVGFANQRCIFTEEEIAGSGPIKLKVTDEVFRDL